MQLLKTLAFVRKAEFWRGLRAHIRAKYRSVHPPEFAGSKPAFLFICGLHRSGTTLITKMIGAHPDVEVFPTTWAPSNEGQHLQSSLPTDVMIGGPGAFALPGRERNLLYGTAGAPEVFKSILKSWSRYANFDRKVFAEKSPPNIIRTRILQDIFPKTKFLFVLRHPIPTALATEKFKKNPGTESITQTLENWCTAHEIMLEDVGYLESYLLVRFEDFVHNSKHLNCVTEFLDLPKYAASERVYDTNKRYFEDWYKKSIIVPNGLSVRLSAISLKLGYTLEPPYVLKESNMYL